MIQVFRLFFQSCLPTGKVARRYCPTNLPEHKKYVIRFWSLYPKSTLRVDDHILQTLMYVFRTKLVNIRSREYNRRIERKLMDNLLEDTSLNAALR